MKQNKTTLYAKALARILSQKEFNEKKVVDNFTALLINSGYARRANDILNLAQDMLLQKQGLRRIIFETAKPMSQSQRTTIEKIAKKGDIVQEKINPELIAGIKITVNNQQQFDNSLLGKLSRLS